MSVVGALIGAFVGWVIYALFGPKGHCESPNWWAWDTEGKVGCLGRLLIVAACAALGAAIGGAGR